ncbi:MAG TPA: hypothetical protein VIL86_20100 [Tepidisphaeraceae bacterium]|jgi:acyl-coenzyme A synthetase/AMP-(fatty) acid ligase
MPLGFPLYGLQRPIQPLFRSRAEAVAAFVTLRAGVKPSEALKKELIQVVRKQIGALAQPDQIRFTGGKIKVTRAFIR